MSNKTSDKNVGGIEDDIKILENLKSYLNLLIYEGNDKIIYNDLLWDEKTVDCIYAMENLINDYTRQKQINEEHQKINGELKKAINTAEKEKGEWIEECQQKDERIKALEEERDHWHGCFIVAMENSIAKEKVINVIQEYKYKIERYDEYRIQGKETDVEYYENIANTIIVQVLQELLEGEK